MTMKPYWLAFLLTACATTHARDFEGVQVVTDHNAGRVNVMVTKDSGWLMMLLNDGSSFVIRADPATMARLANDADRLTDTTHGARLAYMDATMGRQQAMTFTRLSTDSNSAYRITGEDGARTGSLILAPDTARVTFGAMRGKEQHTWAARVIHQFPWDHHVQVPPRERPSAPSLPSTAGQGEVTLSFLVDTTGHVDQQSIVPVGNPDPALTRAAIDNLLQTTFEPAQMKGHLQAERVQKKFVFTLSSQ